MKSELTVSIDRQPAVAGVAGEALAAAAEAKQANADAIVKRRKQLHAQAAKEAVQNAAAPEAPPAKIEPREDLESVLLQLPDGRLVEVGPTPGVSLTMRLLGFYGSGEFSSADEQVTRAMMCVRAIDEKPYPAITNSIERDKLGHLLGDDGIAIIITAYLRYWPALRMAELPVLKKTPRT